MYETINCSALTPLQQQQSILQVKNKLSPPNPIISKNIDSLDQKLKLKLESYIRAYDPQQQKSSQNEHQGMKRESKMRELIDEYQSDEIEYLTLENAYHQRDLIFKKYDNSVCCRKGGKKYPASIFIKVQNEKKVKLPDYKGMIVHSYDLEFDSNYQSSNLMAVYYMGNNTYDLILQNDINTSSFTQWFNFKVQNKNKKNFIVKFNIVNLYKSKSLYMSGMKPIVRSEKSDKNKKKWRRKGFNIAYQKNMISYEDDLKKCYKTLSFSYDFTVENDTVVFAHAMPYDLNDLDKMIASLKGQTKVTLKNVGVTGMGRNLPLIKIEVDKPNKAVKKAIIILARQHPGETPGSYICEQVITQLLKNTSETQFLLNKYDFHIIPMVNMDGVALGNYRGNLFGFDLNRCWQKADKIKQPEVYAIKNYIKKIMKFQPIQLILDLHGHSRKMGSFFYGNNFGKNMLLFPYIASKHNCNIIFEECRFTCDKAEKAQTARVVLGNLIKQTGHVYTYEVSFFGSVKNGNPFSFTEEHFKEIAKSLVYSMYQTFTELYKQEKCLKQSIYLHDINKEIKQFEKIVIIQDDSGSDSEAQELQKDQILINSSQVENVLDVHSIKQTSIQKQQTQIFKQPSHFKLESLKLSEPVESHNEEIKKKIHQIIEKQAKHKQEKLPHLEQRKDKEKIIQYTKQIQNQSSKYLQKLRKYKYYANKLKIYGETFQLKDRSIELKASQILVKARQKSEFLEKKVDNQLSTLNPQKLIKKQYGINRSFKVLNSNADNETGQILQKMQIKQYGKKKYRHLSLAYKQVSSNFDNLLINDMIKINKLEYEKIKREGARSKQKIELSKEIGRNLKLPVL